MSLRTHIRRLRLYYKSLPLLIGTLELPLAALTLPFTHGKVRFESKAGLGLEIPPGAWEQLPNMCRLAQIGASCRIEADCKRIELRLHFLFAV